MHSKRIRHKDVKPHNILIHEGKLIYTDFCISFDSTGLTRSTSKGRPEHLTYRYAAPEVIEHEQRDSKSDVYFVGCVFIEMLSALCPSLAADKKKFKRFSVEIQKVQTELLNLDVQNTLIVVREVIIRMTEREVSSRLYSTDVALRLCQRTETCCTECKESIT